MNDTRTQTQEICIIGAGIGGLAVGALLTKKGYHVSIYEKESFIGGRSLSLVPASLNIDEYKKILTRFHMHIAFSVPNLNTLFENQLFAGYQIDLGYHAIGGGEVSILNDCLSEINEHVDMFETKVGLIKQNDFQFPFLSTFDIIKIIPYILRLLFASEKTLQYLDTISIQETIKKYGKGKMRLILEIFSRSITTVNNLERISTGEMFRSQKNLYKGSKPLGYPKNGLQDIYQRFANFILNHGGEIHLNEPVTNILVNKNQVMGIKTRHGERTYDYIISNILIQDLFSIIDKKHFPKSYVSNIQSLQGTGSLCAYYALENIPNELVGKSFHFIERDVGIDGHDAVGMVDFMTASSPSNCAPHPYHLVQSYIICTPQEAQDQKILQKLRMLLDKNLQILIPNFKSQMQWSIYPAIWHLDGVAKTIDNNKPTIHTPLKNFYLVGDCVKAPGIGMNCAINSAKIAASLISC